jgi:hypothetical protein
MRPTQDYRLLGTVIGGGVGALIGLAFIKFTWIGIPAGAFVGGIIGFILGAGPTSQRGYSDGSDTVENVANVGCMALGCLTDLSWLGCIGCGTMLGTLFAGLVAGIIAPVH